LALPADEAIAGLVGARLAGTEELWGRLWLRVEGLLCQRHRIDGQLTAGGCNEGVTFFEFDGQTLGKPSRHLARRAALIGFDLFDGCR
jgi:hypothetical protein